MGQWGLKNKIMGFMIVLLFAIVFTAATVVAADIVQNGAAEAMLPDTSSNDNRLPLALLLGASTVISAITLVLVIREYRSMKKKK